MDEGNQTITQKGLTDHKERKKRRGKKKNLSKDYPADELSTQALFWTKSFSVKLKESLLPGVEVL